MKWITGTLLIILITSCGRGDKDKGRIITVSIAPFRFFVESIAGDNFKVNVMVPAGANPHIYEPFPDQVSQLARSEAYISNGFLGFEITWLDRFYEINRKMQKLSLGEVIDPIEPSHHDNQHYESADPHYWLSPLCAMKMASSVKDFIIKLDSVNEELYNKNYQDLLLKIASVDSLAKVVGSSDGNKEFMIYHPNLAYLARDYGLVEIPVENDGKEPTPSRLVYLIDKAKKENLRMILVQKEYDTKNAKAIAEETGAKVIVIDPLSEDWYTSTMGILDILKKGFEEEK